jgi:hypothetical protein
MLWLVSIRGTPVPNSRTTHILDRDPGLDRRRAVVGEHSCIRAQVKIDGRGTVDRVLDKLL